MCQASLFFVHLCASVSGAGIAQHTHTHTVSVSHVRSVMLLTLAPLDTVCGSGESGGARHTHAPRLSFYTCLSCDMHSSFHSPRDFEVRSLGRVCVGFTADFPCLVRLSQPQQQQHKPGQRKETAEGEDEERSLLKRVWFVGFDNSSSAASLSLSLTLTQTQVHMQARKHARCSSPTLMC